MPPFILIDNILRISK